MTQIIKIMEIIGTIAFSLSGALVAISSGLDIFGVMFLSSITAFGGGILRDLLLGITPPTIFENFKIFVFALIVSFVTFIVAYILRSKFNSLRPKVEHINNIFDAIGLSLFVVTGSEIACTNGFVENGFIVIFSGMITGIGGGIFRDVLIDTTPYVFKKHVYALAAIFGGCVYFVLRTYQKNINVATVIAMVSIFVIRMLATKYRWSLPKIHIEDKN